MSWDAIEQASFAGEEALVFFHGVWRVTDQMKAWNLKGKDDYLRKVTWINAPAGKKGGKPSNLSHPIAYAVSAKSKNKDLAAYIVALASQPIPNLRHAVSTNHTPINYGEQSMPELVEKGWALAGGDADAEVRELHAEPSEDRPVQRHHLQRHPGRGNGPAQRRRRRPTSWSTSCRTSSART